MKDLKLAKDLTHAFNLSLLLPAGSTKSDLNCSGKPREIANWPCSAALHRCNIYSDILVPIILTPAQKLFDWCFLKFKFATAIELASWPEEQAALCDAKVYF